MNTDDMNLSQSSPSALNENDCTKYPLILTPQQAAELLQVPLSTIYQWSSVGRLKNCARLRGKHLLIHRDKLIDEMLFGKTWPQRRKQKRKNIMAEQTTSGNFEETSERGTEHDNKV